MSIITFNGKSISFGGGLIVTENSTPTPTSTYIWDTSKGFTTSTVGETYYAESNKVLHYCTEAVEKSVIKGSYATFTFDKALESGKIYSLEIGCHSFSIGSTEVGGTTYSVDNNHNTLSLSFDGGSKWYYYHTKDSGGDKTKILETDGAHKGAISDTNATGSFYINGGGTNKLCIGLFWDPYESIMDYTPTEYSAKARCKGLVFDYIRVLDLGVVG